MTSPSEMNLSMLAARYLTPVEAYLIFSRAFAGERFLVEPDIYDEKALYRAFCSEVTHGAKNRFFWKQLLQALPFAHDAISHVMTQFELRALPEPRKKELVLSKKNQLLREAFVAGDAVDGFRNGRFQFEGERVSVDGGVFGDGVDLLHGRPCVFFLYTQEHDSYECMVQLLELAQLPNTNLVSILDIGLHNEQLYVIFDGHEPVPHMDTVADWIACMEALFYAFDSALSRDISLGGLCDQSIYRGSRGRLCLFFPCLVEERSDIDIMVDFGHRVWQGRSDKISFVLSQLQKQEFFVLEEALALLDQEPTVVEEKEYGVLEIDTPPEFLLHSWFGKGKKSFRIRNVGTGPLPMIIRSNHQALHVVQEQPNPHRQEQIIDLIFDPALLKKDFGTVQLRFETERGVQERTVQLRKAFWLWPVIITVILAIILIWFLSA